MGVAESTLHLALYEQMKIFISRRSQEVNDGAREKTTRDHTAIWASISGAAGISKLFAVLIGYPHEVCLLLIPSPGNKTLN